MQLGSILAGWSIPAPFEHCQIQRVSCAGLHQESHREALDQIGYLSEALPGCRTPLLPPTVLVGGGRFCLPPPLCPPRLFPPMLPTLLTSPSCMQHAELSLLSPNQATQGTRPLAPQAEHARPLSTHAGLPLYARCADAEHSFPVAADWHTCRPSSGKLSRTHSAAGALAKGSTKPRHCLVAAARLCALRAGGCRAGRCQQLEQVWPSGYCKASSISWGLVGK